MSPVRIRPMRPDSEAEIERSANWMRATLVEVEDEATAISLHSMEWLRQRVRWHLDPEQSLGTVLLAEHPAGEVLGHTIVRRETEEQGGAYGLVSTTYVLPEARRSGVGAALLQAGEAWFRDHSLASSSTWTSARNSGLICLYQHHGYAITDRQQHDVTGTQMVRLEKAL